MNVKDTKRFWSKVAIGAEDECWPWQGSKRGDYGQFSAQDKNLSSHRVAYELTYGSIPDGLQVLHKCDNPPCCNPHHLFVGTPLANVEDATSKNRRHYASGDAHGSRTHPERRPRGSSHGARTQPAMIAKGENHVNAKLTNDQAATILIAHQKGTPQAQLARTYGVSATTIHNIVRRKTWLHLEPKDK